MENKSLGMLIREERQKHGLTQAQLGKMVGLNAPRISKIEKGAPITPEVASFILGKMGSKLQITVKDSEFNKDTSDFISSVILMFSQSKSIPLPRAYSYLDNFKGLDFLEEYHDIEQTLSNAEILNDVSRICANNGGAL